ncbi:MAG: UbiD family decarboxylase [Burkholderiales bacterium]|nr:UbiD family decarboxylase [Burkholderiales bacterium]
MDFRSALAVCDDAGEVAEIEERVLRAGIPARVRGEERRRNRALLFRRVDDTDAAIVGNLYGSRRRVCRSLAARSYPELFARLDRALADPAPIVRRSNLRHDWEVTNAPDLVRLLPAMRYSRDDVTPYLTSGILLARDPASGDHHLCFVRMSIVGGAKLLVNPATARIRSIVEATVGRGEALDVAVLVGAPAEVTLMACVGVADGVDKLEVAQSLAGGGLAFTDDPLPLPVSTEYVLTGRIVPSFEREGPVGDQKGLYSVRERNPVCLVDAVRVRREPRFHSISGGVSREHIELVTLGPRAVLERVRRDTPGLLRYELPFHAGGRLAVLVVADGYRPAELAERLWKISSVRGFVAVNRDVRALSAPDLLWAIVERAREVERFMFPGPHAPGVKPGKFLIDATETDLDDWNHRRIEVLREPH